MILTGKVTVVVRVVHLIFDGNVIVVVRIVRLGDIDRTMCCCSESGLSDFDRKKLVVVRVVHLIFGGKVTVVVRVVRLFFVGKVIVVVRVIRFSDIDRNSCCCSESGPSVFCRKRLLL